VTGKVPHTISLFATDYLNTTRFLLDLFPSCPLFFLPVIRPSFFSNFPVLFLMPIHFTIGFDYKLRRFRYGV
jgi:hypothetical protein